MLKGIVICISGHPYYGRLAYNLCLSIKAVENFPVAVIYAGRALNHLSDKQKSVFDHVIEMTDPEIPISSGVKLWVNEYTPFKETLLLDADMLWMPKRKPSELFEELQGINFTAITEGYHDYETKEEDINPAYFFWADVNEIAEVYKINKGKIYQWRTEVMYFKKADKIFNLARKVYQNPNLKTVKVYATGIADELGINVSCAVHGIDPHVFRWQPAYWHMLNNMQIPDINSMYNYYLVSFGANNAPGSLKNFYDRVVKAACYKLGHQHLFTLMSKRDYLPERQKM